MAEDRPLDLAPACVTDYRELARRRVPRQLFDYVDGGAYDERTLRANVEDFGGILLRQRILRDVSTVDTRATVLGRALAFPVVLAPVGLAGMFARRGEVQAALAAESAGVAFCESTVSICSIEEVRRATQQPFWYQLYVMRDRGYARSLLERASEAGCDVLVLTVDLPVVGARYRDTRNGMTDPIGAIESIARAADLVAHPQWITDVALGGRPLTFGNLEAAVPGARNPAAFREWVDSQFDPSVTFGDLDWVRAHWKGRIVLKGILDADDAREAARAGVDGIVVSNHGGRQLDSVPSSIRALPDIVDAVGDRLEVLVDGGIRSGLDVAKALAVGARGVMIGRAWVYALAARGGVGVAHVLTVLRRELEVAMALTSATTVAGLDRSKLVSFPRLS